MPSAPNKIPKSMLGIPSILGQERCESYFFFHGETALGNGLRTFLYFLFLAYCFLGLSAITARFFRSMENIVKHTRKVVEVDPYTGGEIIRHEKVWNFTIADISLLAFGTSFPQISLATIDALRNLGNLYAGGLFLWNPPFCCFFHWDFLCQGINLSILWNYRFGSWNTCWFCCFRSFSYPCCLCCGSKSWGIEKDIRHRSLSGGALLVLLGLYLVVHNFGGNLSKFAFVYFVGLVYAAPYVSCFHYIIRKNESSCLFAL